MLRSPPRRSARLNTLIEPTNRALMENNLITIAEESLDANEVPTNNIPAVLANEASANAINMPAKDSSATGTPSNDVHDSATNEAIDLLAMEKRLALLEAHLSATQEQLRERDVENDALRTALHSSRNSAVTYASSMVARSQPAPPPPQPTQAAPPVAAQSRANSSASQPFAEVRNSSTNQPVICGTTSATNNLYSAFHTNGTFSSIPTQTPNFSMPPIANSGYMHSMQYPHQNSFMPRKLLELPEFSGQPEDWPVFYTAFNESTAAYNYSHFDNNQRLQKCLKGDARETVKSLLIHPNNVPCIIEQLKFRYGRPEQLIRSQLLQVREISPISENALSKLIPFAIKVKNICAFLQSASAEHHLSNPILLDELIAKLPMSKRIDWGRYAATIQPRATVSHFSEWLTLLANVICTVHDESQVINREPKRRVILHVDERQQPQKCSVCQGSHKVPECKRFTEKSVSGRWAEVKSRHLCFACLNTGHTTRNCRQRKECAIDGCKRVHHHLLHESKTQRPPAPPPANNTNRVASSQPSSKQTQVDHQQQSSTELGATVLSCATNAAESKLLFRILPVTLYGKRRRIDTYALLDEGSSITMLDDTLANDLQLRGRPNHLNVQWFGGHTVQEPATLVDLSISGTGMDKRHKLSNVYAVKNLQLPSQSLSKYDLMCDNKYLQQLPIQPQTGVVPRLLIGIDNCHLGLASTTIAMRQNGRFAANTELGWVVFGPTRKELPTPSTCLFVNMSPDEKLHSMVAEFFATESFGVRPAPPIESKDDVRARAILKSTTVRVGSRFQTGLLWDRDNVQLPDSYGMAFRRLTSVEKRMSRDVNFAEIYKRMIKSYVEKGYARKLTQAEVTSTTPLTWYLPHFGVVNPNKPAKLRIVFDAAAEVQGVSLNRHLLKGPQEYRPLPSIILHFREGAIGVCGDIREMFHQVVIRPEDRCAQRFLWRNGDTKRQPDIYEMCVMTFGAACSPCAAHYVKTQNALEHNKGDNSTTRAIKAIVDYHYVDDLVDSFSTAEEAIAIASQVIAIHKDAGFEIRNFTSNSPDVFNALGGAGVIKSLDKKEGMTAERVLGLFWHPETDCFYFNIKFNKVSEAVLSGDRCPTKRELLSVVMSIFDPLGFLSHFVIGAKLLMREVWRHEAGWDEPVNDSIADLWDKWRGQLPDLTNFAVPRFYFRNGQPEELQLHIFADASENAFAAVAYWRATNRQGKIEVTLVCAKSKCAPLKPLTIPRLELQAAVLGSRLLQTIREEHTLKIDSCFLWSDSKTVIKWVRSESRRYKPFVQHRIAEILTATKVTNWRWIPTADNVADEATRFNSKISFTPTARWTCGPPFLRQKENTWPSEDVTVVEHEDPEDERRPQYVLTIVSSDFIKFNRFSSLRRLVRTTAWVILFTNLCRRRIQVSKSYGLTARDLEVATRLLCRIAQGEEFGTEIQQIRDGLDISQRSPLMQLSPFLDEEGVLRVRGRIDAASWLPMDARHPIILPSTHELSKLIVAHYHVLMGHQNTEATICSVRRIYWIPRLRTLLRKVIANCQVCRLRKTVPKPPLMGPLPVDRVTPYVRPFAYTGLDYFGPLNVTVRRSTEKRWVALFTCLTVRAVHLEIAHDLSTDSCILAIRNFINRRGVPIRLRSDNGKNFVGVNNEAKRFNEVFDCERIQSELSNKGIDWVFNSPFNPAEGGAWERMVQCVKRVLRQTLKEVAPREHTLNCFLIEAENVVNSRPLTHLPINADQEQPLTPNDFLLGSPNTANTPGSNEDIASTYAVRQQWRIARQMRDHFWKRWIMEYLPTLTRRVKWCQRSTPLKKGDLVFICDPNVPRREWCRGVVEEVYPGRDGEIRQADIKTTSGVKRRAVSKLAVLDVDVGELG